MDREVLNGVVEAADHLDDELERLRKKPDLLRQVRTAVRGDDLDLEGARCMMERVRKRITEMLEG